MLAFNSLSCPLVRSSRCIIYAKANNPSICERHEWSQTDNPRGFRRDPKCPSRELDAQRRMVAAYDAALTRAAELEAQADSVERDAQRQFEAALGLTLPTDLPRRPFQIAHFRDIERWSHEGILQDALLGGAAPDCRYDIVALGDIAAVSYGLQKCPANRAGKHARPYLRVANVQRGYLDLRKIKTIDVPERDMPKYKVQTGDVLLCEGNSAELVGRGAIWNGEIENCVHQNHVLRVRLNPARALPAFVLAYINSSSGQAYFRSKAKRTTNLSSINSREVAGLPLPLPGGFGGASVDHRLSGRGSRESPDFTQVRRHHAGHRLERLCRRHLHLRGGARWTQSPTLFHGGAEELLRRAAAPKRRRRHGRSRGSCCWCALPVQRSWLLRARRSGPRLCCVETELEVPVLGLRVIQPIQCTKHPRMSRVGETGERLGGQTPLGAKVYEPGSASQG